MHWLHRKRDDMSRVFGPAKARATVKTNITAKAKNPGRVILAAASGLSKEVWRPHNMMTCPGFLALAVRLLWTVVLALAAPQKG